MSAAENLSWETMPFTFDDWRPGQKWSFLATANRFQDYHASLVARETLWEEIAPTIHERLAPLLAAGWTPEEPIGPSTFDLKKTEDVDTVLGLDDFLLGALTYTLMPALAGVIRPQPKRFVCYTPCPFTVILRRQVPNPKLVPAA